jgi:hypothetical protein
MEGSKKGDKEGRNLVYQTFPEIIFIIHVSSCNIKIYKKVGIIGTFRSRKLGNLYLVQFIPYLKKINLFLELCKVTWIITCCHHIFSICYPITLKSE